MLEMLAYWKRALPPNQHYLDIAIPAGLSYEVVTADLLPGWHTGGGNAARLFGHEWYVDSCVEDLSHRLDQVSHFPFVGAVPG